MYTYCVYLLDIVVKEIGIYRRQLRYLIEIIHVHIQYSRNYMLIICQKTSFDTVVHDCC